MYNGAIRPRGGGACDQDHFENGRQKYEALGLAGWTGNHRLRKTGRWAHRAIAWVVRLRFGRRPAVPDRVGAVASFHGGGLVTNEPNSPHLQAAKSKAQFLIAIAENDDARSQRQDRSQGNVCQGKPTRGNRGVRWRRAWLVPPGFAGLQRGTSREGMEPLAHALRKSSGVTMLS